MQSKNWQCFIERLIEISEGDITVLDFSGTRNNFNEIKILNDSTDNLSVFVKIIIIKFITVSHIILVNN